MDLETKRLIKEATSDELYSALLMNSEVHVFDCLFHDKAEAFQKYDKFKTYFSKKFDIHFNDISIVGSAKLGYSCNPQKNFKPFDQESDIDVVIVSRELFNKFWNEYLDEHYTVTGIRGYYQKVTSSIFRKFIVLYAFENTQIGSRNDFYKEWEKRILGFKKDVSLLFGINNDINYRIFESWDAVKMYYVNSFDKMKNTLNQEEI